MARKPSSASHRQRPMDGLNLTPFIDMITCLMFFLLMFAAVIPVSIIDAPLPKVASTADEVKKAKDDKNKMEVTVYIDAKGLRVRSDFGGERTFPMEASTKQGDTPKPDFKELHKFLVQLHAKKPDAREITLMPSDDVPYEMMILVMDAARELAKDDTGYQAVPPEISQKPESLQFNRLFPDVSIGGV